MLVSIDKASAATKSKAMADEYMNKSELQQFKALLEQQRSDLYSQASNADIGEVEIAADPNDRASQETERANAAKTIERAHKQIREINAALVRIEQGDFGYCEESGEPIGRKRLMANPTARCTFEVQSAREKRQSQFGAN